MIHAVDPKNSEVIRFVEARGAHVVPIVPFDERSPHCNKITGALTLSVTSCNGPVALTDTDMLIMADPTEAALTPGTIAGKRVDLANPPLEILQSVFAKAGLATPPVLPPPATTLLGNLNGGLYVLNNSDLKNLASTWEQWALWLLDRRSLLGSFAVHVDQVAMCLAITDLELHIELLDESWNLPTHLEQEPPQDFQSPKVLHYHRRVTATGLVETTGYAVVDDAIIRANVAISQIFSECFPNRVFWSWRYRTKPGLGSGVGTEPAALKSKQLLLATVVNEFDPATVIDVGCGDGVAVDHLQLKSYTGITQEATELASERQPGGKFLVGDPTDFDLEADLILCLGVLIHQREPDRYRALVEWILSSSTVAVFISGFDVLAQWQRLHLQTR